MLDAISAMQLAMDFSQLKLQTLSNNISNMNTPGFKRQSLEYSSFDEQLLSNASQISTQGAFTQTHQPKDLALSGTGYFQVQNEQGLFYTRRGDFKVNEHGELSTATGEVVLGKSGVIKVDDFDFSVNSSGAIFIDHRKVDQLNLVQFNQPNRLEYIGNGLYQCTEPALPISAQTRVLQGFIEQSNVTSVDEMMDLIKTSRHFESSQRVMSTANNLLATAINQLGEGNV